MIHKKIGIFIQLGELHSVMISGIYKVNVDDIIGSTKMSPNYWNCRKENMFNFSVINLPADGVAPLGARASADKVMTKFMSCKYTYLAHEGLSEVKIYKTAAPKELICLLLGVGQHGHKTPSVPWEITKDPYTRTNAPWLGKLWLAPHCMIIWPPGGWG